MTTLEARSILQRHRYIVDRYNQVKPPEKTRARRVKSNDSSDSEEKQEMQFELDLEF